jgi:hypothetical protein
MLKQRLLTNMSTFYPVVFYGIYRYSEHIYHFMLIYYCFGVFSETVLFYWLKFVKKSVSQLHRKSIIIVGSSIMYHIYVTFHSSAIVQLRIL